MSTLKYKNPNWVEGSGQPKWIVVGSGGSSGGNEAEIMAELQKLLDEKVEEAPMDGNQYVRTNGTWSVAQMAMSSKEKCTINLVSNQGEGDAASLYGATVKVTDVDSDEVYLDEVWDGIPFVLEFAGGVNYKIEVGDVADYATPEAKTLTALEFNVRNMLFTYNTEIVSVMLSSDTGSSVSGQIVTINERSFVFDGVTSITNKIAYGVEYSISANDRDGFYAPLAQTYVAGMPQRNVNLEYTEIQYGVRILTTDGHFIKKEDWNNSMQPNGVSLITENVRLIISLTAVTDDVIKYGSPYQNLDKMVEVPTEAGAIIDYDGVGNTERGGNYCSWQTIFTICTSFIFPDGVTTGYLGAAGEWVEVTNNITEINEALAACGGDVIDRIVDYAYATSSYAGENSTNYDWWVIRVKTNTLVKGASNGTYKCRIFGNI